MLHLFMVLASVFGAILGQEYGSEEETDITGLKKMIDSIKAELDTQAQKHSIEIRNLQEKNVILEQKVAKLETSSQALPGNVFLCVKVK